MNLFAWGNTGKMGDGHFGWLGRLVQGEDGVRSLEMLRVGRVGPEFAMGGAI